MPLKVKLVLFDALYTLVAPRLPIHIQYANVFQPHLGKLDPCRVKTAFQSSLKDIQQRKPAYVHGANRWWQHVVRETAIGAGADPQAVDASLSTIVPELLRRFSGSEGYMLYPDVIPTLTYLKSERIQMGLVSNTDLRMKSVLLELKVSQFLDPMLFSEEEGIEKPAKEIWNRACSLARVKPEEALHVGDELECDYEGAQRAGLAALLLRRSEPKADEDLTSVKVISNLSQIISGPWLTRKNGGKVDV